MSQPQPPLSSHQAIEGLLAKAEEAWGTQDYQKSIQLIQQASRLDPGNPSLVMQVAKAYGMRYDYPRAGEWLERAIQLWPRDRRGEALAEAGRIALEFEQVDMAIGYFERAAREKDVSLGTLITLSDIMIRERRIDDAAELTARAAKINKSDARVALTEAKLLRARGQAQEAEAALRA